MVFLQHTETTIATDVASLNGSNIVRECPQVSIILQVFIFIAMDIWVPCWIIMACLHIWMLILRLCIYNDKLYSCSLIFN